MVCNPTALTYFKAALDKYENFPTVFSISAFMFPNFAELLPSDYSFNVFFTMRMHC